MTQQKDWSAFKDYLLPIRSDAPVGDFLRYDAVYDQIRGARRQEDVRLPQGVWQRDLKMADWAVSEKLCQEVLVRRSKDLQVAAWLAEAWLHLRGIRGFSDGVQLMHALCETYWDQIYPQIDDSGSDYRVAPIDWLNDKISKQMGLYAISNPEKEGVYFFSLGDFEYIQNNGEKNPDSNSPAGGKILNISAMQASIDATANYFYEVLYHDSLFAIKVLEEFESFLEDKLPNQMVSLYQLRKALGTFRDVMLSVLRERDLLSGEPKTLELSTMEETENSNETPVSEGSPAMETIVPTGPITNREQAYALIGEIARYLEVAEPHSPTPYLLKKAISWGNMPLSYLLNEFIQNNMDFAQLQRWLGIPNPGQAEAPAKSNVG